MANRHIQPTATGAGTGLTWTDAFTAIPTTLSRDNVYYLGSGVIDIPGSPPVYEVDDVEDGVKLIELRKATVADHGSDTGWDDAFHAQIRFNGGFAANRNYFFLNGVYMNPLDRRDTSAYGIRITGNVTVWPINYAPGGDHIHVACVDGGADVGSVYPSIGSQACYFVGNQFEIGGKVITDILVEDCHFHNCITFMLVDVNGVVVRNCRFTDMWGKEAIRGFSTCKNGQLYNLSFRDTTQDTGLPGETGTCPIAIWDSATPGDFDNWTLYNIEIFNTKSIALSGGAINVGGNQAGWTGEPANNVKIYNVTVAGLTTGLNSGVYINGGDPAFAAGNEIRNTIVTDDCILTSDISPNTSGNSLFISTDIFMDYAAKDLRLKAPLAGTTLGSPYDVDIDGNSRSDGVFDRGAREYPEDGDTLILDQTANSNPVTELWRKAHVTDGVADALEDVIVQHSRAYPTQQQRDFVYAKHGGPDKHVYIWEGTLSLSEAVALRDAL